jgi:type IV pilus assembly protein PilV
MFRMTPPRPRQAGVTLVEILVTVVIISVGLLGVASLHLNSLRSGQGAHTRSQATALANDIIDRMRANRDAAIGNAYVMLMTATPPTTATGLVDKDKKQWLEALAQALPEGDGSVTEAMVAGRKYFRITIQWHERKSSTTVAAAALEATPPNTFETLVEL